MLNDAWQMVKRADLAISAKDLEGAADLAASGLAAIQRSSDHCQPHGRRRAGTSGAPVAAA